MEKIEPAGSVDSERVIELLQRSMALKESDKKESLNTGKRHSGCDGHGCQPTCGYHGYCDYEATRYYNSSKGQAEGKHSKGERHDYYKRNMRL